MKVYFTHSVTHCWGTDPKLKLKLIQSPDPNSFTRMSHCFSVTHVRTSLKSIQICEKFAHELLSVF